MNKTSGRWKLGFVLALLTAMLWGVLPIALKIALKSIDPYTVTWYRFASSALILAIVLGLTRSLPDIGKFDRRTWILMAIAFVGLTGNYVLYIVALVHTFPTLTQTVAQLGPMILLLGGLVVFKEKFSGLQWLGFAMLMAGLALFFHDKLIELSHITGDLGLGVLFLTLASFIWAAYGLAQKRLLRTLGPQQILLILYLGAGLVLIPAASPASVRQADTLQLSMLAFCCLNTLVAYGAFAEGLKHWEVSRFGAVLATAPLFTVAGMWIVGRFAPNLVAAERLDALSILGTLLVVLGSVTCAIARR
ncbi:MAG TPA: DMT family transporter [Terriglobia bacterium]|nr:DMT family transporter [Terriglobia bacterium]